MEELFIVDGNYQKYMIVSGVIAVLLLSFFVRNILIILLSLEGNSMHRKRMKELNKSKAKTGLSSEFDIQALIQRITKPIIITFLSEINQNKITVIEDRLTLSKWDKFFSSPKEFIALNYLLKFLSVVSIFLMWNINKPIAIIWGLILAMGLSFFLKNSYVNKKATLIADFPDFIRITAGYLISGMPFNEAIKETIPYVNEEWQDILKRFAINMEVKNINIALDELKKEVNLFEVREFVSLIKLNLEQGGEVKKSFSEQADRLQELRENAIMITIGKRHTMSTMLQGPILLSSLLMFALPTIGSLLDLGLF